MELSLEMLEFFLQRHFKFKVLNDKVLIFREDEDLNNVDLTKGAYEFFQIFDQNDQTIMISDYQGSPSPCEVMLFRKDCHGPDRFPNVFHRGGNCFVVNKNHELLVPIRSNSKDLYPGAKDVSVSEHNKVGESYYDCVLRGFEEELGFKPDIKNLKLKIKIPVISADQSEICEYYLYKDEGSNIQIAEDEIKSVVWIPFRELDGQDLVRKFNFRPDHASALKYIVDNYKI